MLKIKKISLMVFFMTLFSSAMAGDFVKMRINFQEFDFKEKCAEMSNCLGMGDKKKACLVCTGQSTCSSEFKEGIKQEMCETYLEGRSCFMAIDDKRHRNWCQYIQDKKSCFMAFNGEDRDQCKKGNAFKNHYQILKNFFF